MPSNFLKWGKAGADYVVLVDKSQQKVMLYRSDNLLEPVKVYRCSTGESDGRKSALNDKKTPEGIYFFVKSYTKESLAPVYGARALPLNYPNIFDIKEGRDGYGIWFHGLNKPLKPYDTSGCVALENKDIEELATYVSLFNTPVIISSSIEMSSQEELETKAKDISDIIEGWRDSWQNKDVDRYMSFYSSSFKSGGKTWDQWKDYKKQVANKYKDIRVKVNDLGILMNNNMVIASFKQIYRTSSFESSGTKRLYIAKNSDEWKIIGEDFNLEKVKPVKGIDFENDGVQVASVDPEQIDTAAPIQGNDVETDTVQVASLTPALENMQDKDPGQITQATLQPDIGAEGVDTVQVATATTAPENLPAPAVDEGEALPAAVPQPGTQGKDGDSGSVQVAAIAPSSENLQIQTGEKEPDAVKTLQGDIKQKETSETIQSFLTGSQPEGVKLEVEAVICAWIDAWENKDIERYMAFYDTGFKSRDMDLKEWKRHRNRLNERYHNVSVDISGLEIKMVSDVEAGVAFVQEYQADNYADYGEKNMILIKEGKEWKIKTEEWTAIKR